MAGRNRSANAPRLRDLAVGVYPQALTNPLITQMLVRPVGVYRWRNRDPASGMARVLPFSTNLNRPMATAPLGRATAVPLFDRHGTFVTPGAAKRDGAAYARRLP